MPKPTSAAQLSQTSETKKQLQIEGPQYSPEELSVTHSKAWDAFIFSWCNKNIVILNPHPYISMIGQFTPANFLQDFKNNTSFISGKTGATSHASVSTVDGASKQLQIEGPLYPASKATNSCSGSGPASLVTFKPPKQQLSIEIFTASNSLQDVNDISTPLSGQTCSTTHDEASIDDEAVQISRTFHAKSGNPWYKPNTFNFDAIAQSDPPESISRHERFLWNALKNFAMPTPTFIERGMHYVLAALVLIGSDAEKAHFSQELPDVSPISRGARTAYSCWHHYKKLSSLRWAKIVAKKSEAAADGCIEDLDRLIAIIYTMVETFASIWASTTLKADIEATEQSIKKSRSTKEIDRLTSGLEQLKKTRSQIKVEYTNLPALVGFLCSGVKGLMIYPTDGRVFSPLRAVNFLLVTSHLAQSDQSISEPIWKRTQSYIVDFLKAVILPTKEWVPRELNRYHLAKALFLDFSDYCISRNMTTIYIPKCRNYKVNDKTYM
ncbi:uncharacterized protein MELLADRAFT_67552 [Melampsora larici-populina 98AG31]|uniref:Uncharacterized protein n=1 Tax=Melampsora larici-populina (strain 98AG31 / pathotype 3-4-7) TaxID=747676 RepID=F4S3K0_MELLP|nr:uncharacterized protein MELLADRAFT_67552 [Melampsora larici-populina 98AG31]EGG00682.1 hypothetical protein MELLADRAFT_67552 [Melampsora larici-populina 98AG31]